MEPPAGSGPPEPVPLGRGVFPYQACTIAETGRS